MVTDETQIEQGEPPGGLQNHFNREPHEKILPQGRKDAKMGNFNHG